MHLNILLHRFSASHHLSFLMSSYFHFPSVIQSPEACTRVISPPFLVQTSRRNVRCLMGWCLVFIWAAACSGCNLLYTQVVWLCCKPESSAGVSPFLSLQGNDQRKQSRRSHSLSKSWALLQTTSWAGLAFSLSHMLLRKSRKDNTRCQNISTAGSFQAS